MPSIPKGSDTLSGAIGLAEHDSTHEAVENIGGMQVRGRIQIVVLGANFPVSSYLPLLQCPLLHIDLFPSGARQSTSPWERSFSFHSAKEFLILGGYTRRFAEITGLIVFFSDG